jgi:uncharacterized surface protein with fasciclin (FAS1) repeats
MKLVNSAAAALLAVGVAVAAPAFAKVTKVGGAPMYDSKTIAQNAPNAPNLTTLVAAVKAAGLVDTLAGPGPFTVFAPTNSAFEKLPAGTVESLVKPENKATLTKILTYHVVSGDYSAKELMMGAKKQGGMKLTTVEGEPLTVKMAKGKLVVVDAKGGTSTIQTKDVEQKNGVVHVVNAVLMP